MTVDEAYDRICRAIDAGRPANGYLVVGGVRGMGGELSDRVLRHLFGDVDLLAHPDIHRLAPEKKSRIISVESMRTRLVGAMEMTSYQGGWKAGVVVNADRMKAEASNAFLKTLEEPPPRTLFLLLTERPEQLLPTIVSRCQRVDLPDARARLLDEPWCGRVIDILAADALVGQTARAAAAARLAAVLEELKEMAKELVDEEVTEIDDGAGEEASKDSVDALVSSRYREFRVDFTATVMSWFRDLMALRAAPPSHSAYDDSGAGTPLVNGTKRAVLETRAARLTRAAAFANVEAVEEFATSLDRNLSELPVLGFLMDRLVFGTEGA
jgi:DNA polymerase-3 subunit delta'